MGRASGSVSGLLVTMLVCGVVLATHATVASSAELSIEQRMACQRAVAEVYWQHMDWPQPEGTPKPGIDSVLPADVLRSQAEDGVRKSRALAEYWNRPISAADFQNELDRMAVESEWPELLAEIYAALDDDPFLVAECLVRPALADRWAREEFAEDVRIHGKQRALVEAEAARMATPSAMKTSSGTYAEVEWLLQEEDETAGQVMTENDGWLSMVMNPSTWMKSRADLDRRMTDAIPGRPSPVIEGEESLRVVAILSESKKKLRLATATWAKKPFDEWWTEARQWYPSEAAQTEEGLSLRPPANKVLAEGWSMLSTTSNPDDREHHTIVSTGTHMIVWGGKNGIGILYGGSRYNLATGSWSATSTGTNRPDARYLHSAVWSGDYMVIWGGFSGSTLLTNGGRYNPVANTWATMSTNSVPAGRINHSTTWTYGKMCVWGGAVFGSVLGNGGCYNPGTNTWSTISNTGAPTARMNHSAVYFPTPDTEEYMVVWGGENTVGTFLTGARYRLDNNTWVSMSSVGAPSARTNHVGVLGLAQREFDRRMVVWGGYTGSSTTITGGLYDAINNQWESMSASGTPSSRQGAIGFTDGRRIHVWGGYSGTEEFSSGAIYNHVNNVWRSMSASPLSGRKHHAGMTYGSTDATGLNSKFITWGGYDSDEVDDGARYTPADDFMVDCGSRNISVLANSTYFSPLLCMASGFEDFATNVTFSCSGTFVSNCQFSPNPNNPGASVSLSALSNAYPTTGEIDFTIFGSAGGVTRGYKMTATVQDYTFSCTPSSLTITAGESGQTTCTVTSVNGFVDRVYLDAAPHGFLSDSFSPTSVVFPADGYGTTTLTISADAGATVGVTGMELWASVDGQVKVEDISVTIEAGADLPFSDGFETGDTSEWSSAVP